MKELQEQLSSVRFDDPNSLGDQAKPILSNENIFGVDLYKAGIGEKIEAILRCKLEGSGAVRRTIQKFSSKYHFVVVRKSVFGYNTNKDKIMIKFG